MKRQIKFRRWHKQLLDMRYSESLSDFFNMVETYKDQYEIMQFTGLVDKNGKEIYENDIIHYIGFKKREYTGPIIFDNGSFCAYGFYMTHLDNPYDFTEELSKVEVIGNIYSDPQLL